MALPKRHRLRHRRDFDRVYRKGRRLSGRCFGLRALRSRAAAPRAGTADGDRAAPQPPQPTQFGIAVGKKIDKRAVVRNRLRRQVRAALRQLLPRCTPGWQVAIVARPAALGCNYADYLQELEHLLAEAGVVRRPGAAGGRVAESPAIDPRRSRSRAAEGSSRHSPAPPRRTTGPRG